MSEEVKNQTPEKVPDNSKKQHSVFIYLAILFAAAFLMLLLAYFMQQRTSQATIGSLTQSITSIESLDKLLEANEELQDQVDYLETKVFSLQEENQQLTDESKKYAEYTRLVITLRQAEELAHSGDLEGAQAALDSWDMAHLTKVLAQYDAEQTEAGGPLLSPAFRALEKLLQE